MKSAFLKKLHECRWYIAVGIIVLLAVTTIGFAGYSLSLGDRVQKADDLRASEKRAEVARAASEKRNAKARAESECRSSIAGAKQGRIIIEDLRSTYLDLADSARNSDVAKTLRKRAKNLPVFPVPDCEPGKKPKPVKP